MHRMRYQVSLPGRQPLIMSLNIEASTTETASNTHSAKSLHLPCLDEQEMEKGEHAEKHDT